MALDSVKMVGSGPVQGQGHFGQARLVGWPGVGVLQVWRGQHGQKLEYAGTWRHDLNDPPQAGEREELERAMREGRAVPFEGKLDDPGQPEKESVTASVRISSMSDYAYVMDPNDPRSPTVDVTVVNFRPVDEVEGT